jgi:hypothetical protein
MAPTSRCCPGTQPDDASVGAMEHRPAASPLHSSARAILRSTHIADSRRCRRHSGNQHPGSRRTMGTGPESGLDDDARIRRPAPAVCAAASLFSAFFPSYRGAVAAYSCSGVWGHPDAASSVRDGTITTGSSSTCTAAARYAGTIRSSAASPTATCASQRIAGVRSSAICTGTGPASRSSWPRATRPLPLPDVRCVASSTAGRVWLRRLP